MEQPAKSKEEVENLLKRLYQDREKRAKEIYHKTLYVNPPTPKDKERGNSWKNRNRTTYGN